MKSAFLAISAFLFFTISCSRTDDVTEQQVQETSFFNLKVGNEWVYKTYDRADFNSELTANGEVDSIKIVSQVSLNGKNYYKVENINTQPPNHYPNRTVSYSYWRVNEKGHLVSLTSYNFNQGNTSENFEWVKHPGKDASYTYRDPSMDQFGNITYKLYPETTITLNNQSYKVSPYNGQFVPNSQNPNLVPKLIENNFSEGIGLVKSVCHSVSGTYNFEQHLVSCSLK